MNAAFESLDAFSDIFSDASDRCRFAVVFPPKKPHTCQGIISKMGSSKSFTVFRDNSIKGIAENIFFRMCAVKDLSPILAKRPTNTFLAEYE